MKKFLVLFRAPAKSIEQMMKATVEQQKIGMDRWMAWSKDAAEALVDMGAPLGKTSRVTKENGVSPTTDNLCGYSIIEAESKETLAELLKGHPIS
jgi:predicted metal-binding transcription factor (methanogenesis marker protein 9)